MTKKTVVFNWKVLVTKSTVSTVHPFPPLPTISHLLLLFSKLTREMLLDLLHGTVRKIGGKILKFPQILKKNIPWISKKIEVKF